MRRNSAQNIFVKIVCGAFFVHILAFNLLATTIVAVKTRKEIVIGADSKVTDTFGRPTGNTACKIVAAGNLYFAYAGFARNTRSGFSIPQIASETLNKNAKLSVSEKVEILTKTLVEKLDIELPQLKQTDFVTYREKIEGKTFLRLLIAGFEKGRPALFVRQFRLGQTAENKVGVIVTNDDCDTLCKEKRVTRFLGETDAIDGLPEETKDFWKEGLVSGVRRLVEIQIAAREDYVGPPVDILQITSKRAVWIQKKAECG